MAKEFRQNENYETIKKDYVSPTVDVQESEGKGNRYSLPYGLCKGEGIDTTGMTPREAWDAYTNKTGISKDQAEKEHYGKTQNQENIKENVSDKQKKEMVEKQRYDAIQNPRQQYTKHITKERVEALWKYGNEEAQELTCRLFNEDAFGIGQAVRGRTSAYFPAYNKVGYMETSDTGNIAYSDGGVWYHEIWHGIDNNYGVVTEEELKAKKETMSKYFLSKEHIESAALEALVRNRPLSSSYKTSNGKTLQETLKEEYDTVDIGLVFERYSQELNAYYTSKGYNRKEILDKYNQLEKKKDQVWSDVYNKTNSWYDANKARDEFKATEEYQEAYRLYNACRLEHPNELMKKWGDLSDVISGATKDKKNLGMHHNTKYWKEDATHRGQEFFAECASAKATNPESYKLLKEYLPYSVNAFEELYQKLLKGEIKSYGRKQWQP